jgi:dTDP-4-dehydrorhamnose reductase
LRIAVTGAGGGLGRAFLAQAPAGLEIHAFTHEELPVEDADAVLDHLIPLRAQVVLHLAAMTGVDDCERDPDAAFRANALGTANVANAAGRTGGVMVAVSTDYVFDGTKGEPYHEFDEARPINVYGASKLAGEREARRLTLGHLLLRTSWVFGADDDFITRSVRRLAGGETVGGLVDRWGTPTFVEHLAERLLPLARSGRRGVVHVAGPERTTWFDVLSRAKQLGGLDGEVKEQRSAELDRPAPRPADSSLRSLVLPVNGVSPMPPLDEGIRRLVEVAGGSG